MSSSSHAAIDPVCGMNVASLTRTTKLIHKRKSQIFCSEYCKKRFRETPERFLGTPLIRCENVWKVFQKGGVETAALRGLYLNIWEGDFVVIIGASGSGKSTVLNMIGLLDRPTKGKVFIKGRDASTFSEEERAQIRSKLFGFVFQQYNLIPWLTAYENAVLPILFAGGQVDQKAISEEFERYGLKERMSHLPVELSGGEQQRTALLRSLSNNPSVILGDEPTGNLDSKTGMRILNGLIRMHDEQNKTLIIVSHDAGVAALGHQILTIKDGISVQDYSAYRSQYTH